MSMSAFIVLGLIPGTHIEISFALWLLATSTVFALLVARIVRNSRAIREWIVTVRVVMLTRRRLLA